MQPLTPDKLSAGDAGGPASPADANMPAGVGAPMERPAPHKSRPRRQRRRRARLSLTVLLTLIVMGIGFFYLTLAYTGKSLRLPTVAVAEVEARLNAGLVGARLPVGAAVSIGALEFTVDDGFAPQMKLRDIRLIDDAGRSILVLPEALVAFSPGALLSGQLRPSAIRLSGARLSVRRGADGTFDLDLGAAGGGPKSLAEVLALTKRVLAMPALAELVVLEADALTLSLRDDRAGRSWQVGDGRLTISNGPDSVAAELGLTLLEGSVPAQATLLMMLAKSGAGDAKVTATIDNMSAADLATLSAPLAWLAVVDAPISGELTASVGADGTVLGLSADLSLAAGNISPAKGARPVGFDRARLALGYDPTNARLTLTALEVESRSLRLTATGHGDLLDAAGATIQPGDLPQSLLAQIAFAEVMVDPEGMFEAPVRFTEGALDVRLRLDPFRLDIGQLALVEGEESLWLSGAVEASPEGWGAALDMEVNRIEADRLLKLWPVSAVPKTRDWLVANVGQASLTDVRAALRLDPGQEPRFSLGYEFAEAEVRIVRTLPPVLDARGYASLDGKTYTAKLDRGHLVAPEGGRIEAGGSVFQVVDITEVPANAKISLVTSSSLTATLSLLDQEPFSFFSKVGQPVNLGDGRAELRTTLLMPLKPAVAFSEFSFVVSGRITDFTSPALVPGRILTAPEIVVDVDTDGLSLAGKGMLDLLPVDLTYLQGFGPEQNGRARINGTVTLSNIALRDLGIALPDGMIDGEAEAAIDIALIQGLPPQLTLTSTLVGMALRFDPLSWSKPAETSASLDLEALLANEPSVERMVLDAPGLRAEGRIDTVTAGGLDKAEFSRVMAGDWLDASVTLTGTGVDSAPTVEVTGGSLDMRYMPKGGAPSAGGGSIDVTLDQLRLSSGIALTGFQGNFSTAGGLQGRFVSRVNGEGEIRGEVVPAEGGSAVRITSDNAGEVVAAAGIFDNGRGGSLDLSFTPRGPEGHYDGSASFGRVTVQGAPALAELLSAISVVGLLEQMAGEGLVFNSGEVRFILTPEAIEISQGSAVGASLGISVAGLYETKGGRLDMRGVISPIYLLNGVGQLVSRRGEGLFGFNYRLTGTGEAPSVAINPLSLLTPGMFREIFRTAPPDLEDLIGEAE